MDARPCISEIECVHEERRALAGTESEVWRWRLDDFVRWFVCRSRVWRSERQNVQMGRLDSLFLDAGGSDVDEIVTTN